MTKSEEKELKKVCFLNGHLILRKHKTGVHYLHEQITKRICDNENGYRTNIAYFDKKNKYSQFLSQPEYEWMKDRVNVCTSYPRILSYMLPIELFFGKNDVYFCDGLFPITSQKSKRICIVHDLMVRIYPENYSMIKKIYLRWFFAHLKKADKIVCVSENTKKDIVRFYHIDPSKITVCYASAERSEVHSSIPENKDISLNNPFFFYIGDMRKNKNLEKTLKGFIQFCEDNPSSDIHFYLAGNQNGEYENLRQLVNQSNYSDRIKFLGYISGNDKAYLYEHAAALVLLSEYEGFGIPLVEAMQKYTPIITSNCSSMLEVGEGAAVLADPTNINDIASAMKTITSDYKINKDVYDAKTAMYSFENVAGIINKEIQKLLNE